MSLTHEDYVNMLKDTALKMGKKALKDKALKVVPFLFWGPLGPITEIVIGKVVETVIIQSELVAFYYYIDLRTSSQGRAFSRAAHANYKAQQSGTEEEKKKAEKDLIEAFNNFAILGR